MNSLMQTYNKAITHGLEHPPIKLRHFQGVMCKNMIRFLLLMFLSLSVSAENDISGLYTTVSESEWNITVELKNNGDATIELTNWLAGEYDNREIYTYTGVWRKEGSKVHVTYNGITEILKYHESLSLSELGQSGGLPGLQGNTKPEGKKIIGNYSLWIDEGLKNLYK